MEFRILGPLEVVEGGRPLELPRGKPRALLLALLLRANEVVASDRLIDDLWAGEPPPSAAKSVQLYIGHLRKVLPEGRLVTKAPGYVIEVRPGELDVERAESLSRQAAEAEPAEAARLLRMALALWRGEPLADVSYESWALPTARRLSELRLTLYEQRVDADLALGRHRELVPELNAAVAGHPLRERLRGQQMLALYRSRRQADALAAYRDARRVLNDELGLEPSPELQQLERAILGHDTTIASPVSLPSQLRRGGWRLAVGGFAIACAAVVAALALTRGPTGLSRVAPNVVAVLDPSSGRIVGQIPAGGSRPTEIATDARDVWVLNADGGTVSRIDPATRRLEETFSTSSTPTDIAAGAGALWVGNKGTGPNAADTSLPFSLSRFDTLLRTTSAATRLVVPHPVGYSGPPPGEVNVVVGGASVWAIGPDQTIFQLNPRTRRVVRKIALQATSLAFGSGSLWAVEFNGDDVARIDPATGTIRQRIAIPSFLLPTAIAVGGGYVWAVSPLAGVVWRIEPGPPASLISITVGFGASVIAYGSGALWIGNDTSDTVSRLDPRTSRITATAHVPSPQGISVADDAVWVSAGSTANRSGPLVAPACQAPAGPANPDVRIVSDLALEGNFGLYTRPAQRAILGVLRSHDFRAGRFTVGYQACDDSTALAGAPDLSRCTANATEYAADLSVVAVIGPSSSDCALSQVPVASRAPDGPLALVTPLATASSLSRRMIGLPNDFLTALYPNGPGSFFRTIGDNHIQVAADAELAQQLGLHRVAILYNQQGFTSQTSAHWFAYSSKQLHGAATIPILWNGASSGKLVARLRQGSTDGVFITAPLAPPATIAALLEQIRAVFGARYAVIVTDEFLPWPGFVQAVGQSAAGVYASVAGITSPADLPPAGRQSLKGDRGPTWSVATSVAAVQAVLAAIANSNGTRVSVLHALQDLRLASTAVGPLAFDHAGEPTTAAVTIFRIEPHVTNATGTHDFQDAIIDRVVTPPATALAPP